MESELPSQTTKYSATVFDLSINCSLEIFLRKTPCKAIEANCNCIPFQVEIFLEHPSNLQRVNVCVCAWSIEIALL